MGQCFVSAKLKLKEQEFVLQELLCKRLTSTKTPFQRENFCSVGYRVNKQIIKFTTEPVLFSTHKTKIKNF